MGGSDTEVHALARVAAIRGAKYAPQRDRSCDTSRLVADGGGERRTYAHSDGASIRRCDLMDATVIATVAGGEDHVLGVVDRFARYGLPLHLTETSLVSGELMPPDIVDLNDFHVQEWPSTPEGEARQADEIERHYRSLMSHPAVQAITYWGITDAGAWLGAPIGLVRADGTPKVGSRSPDSVETISFTSARHPSRSLWLPISSGW